jgi:hypothetical protein
MKNAVIIALIILVTLLGLQLIAAADRNRTLTARAAVLTERPTEDRRHYVCFCDTCCQEHEAARNPDGIDY